MESTVREGMSLDDFLREGSTHRFEIINGERIELLPNPAAHSEVIQTIFIALYLFCKSHGLGRVYSETTFILRDANNPTWVRGSRVPDVMFFSGDRINEHREQNPDWIDRPYPLVPDLVIEVVSNNDTYSAVNRKVDAYLEDGVRLIWVVDPQRRKAVVHTPDVEHPIRLSGDDTLEGDDVIPGFKISLPEVFAEL